MWSKWKYIFYIEFWMCQTLWESMPHQSWTSPLVTDLIQWIPLWSWHLNLNICWYSHNLELLYLIFKGEFKILLLLLHFLQQVYTLLLYQIYKAGSTKSMLEQKVLSSPAEAVCTLFQLAIVISWATNWVFKLCWKISKLRIITYKL